MILIKSMTSIHIE